MNNIIYIIIIFQFLEISVFSQTGSRIKNDVNDFFRIGGDIFSAPAHFDNTDFLNLSGTLVLTGSAFLLDDEIKEFSQANKSSFLDVLFEIDRYYHWESMMISIAGFYAIGMAAENEVRKLSVQLTESVVFSSLINLTAKFLAGRARPYMDVGNTDFQPFNFTWEHSSIPSGHTTLSFAYSTVMADVYNNFLWKFGWYSAAVLVGAARIYHNAHWFSDTILGAAIGYLVGRFVINHPFNKQSLGTPSDNISFSFYVPLP